MKRKKENQKALPKGWREVRLGEVCSIDKRALSSQTPHDYCFDYISLSDIERGRLLKTQKCKYSEAPSRARRIVAKGDVLLATVRPYLQGFYIFRNHVKDCIVSTGFAVLSPKSNLLNSSYLYEILFSQYMMATYHAFNVGSNYPAVNSSDIRKFKIPLPPLPEQKAIASLLETWDAAIEKTEALIAAKEKRLDALYQNYFRPGSPQNKNWDSRRIGKFLSVRKERSVPTKEMPLYSLTIEDGVTAKTDRYNREFLVKNQEAKTYKVVYPKDIVFNPSNLRWGAIASSGVSTKVVLSPIYEVLEVSDNLIDHDFLTHAVTCPRQIAIFATKVEGSLIERMAVKVGAFRLCKILVPQSMEEQKRVSKILNTAKHEIKSLRALTEKYYTQKRGLMQKLLTGEWRVKA